MQDFASQIVQSIFAGTSTESSATHPAEFSSSVREFSTKRVSEAVVKPKAQKPSDSSILGAAGPSSSSNRKKSPVRWKDPLQKNSTRKKGKVKRHKSDQDIVALVKDGNQEEALRLEHGFINQRIEQYIEDLSHDIFVEAIEDIRSLYYSEESQSEASSSVSRSNSNSSGKRQVAGYIGGLMKNVWSHSTYSIRKQFKNDQQDEQTWTSDSEIDHDLDLFIYADDFVNRVLDEAVTAYKNEKREEQQKLERMWQKALDKFKADAKYFDAEFSRYWKNQQSIRDRYIHPMTSRIQQEMLRRRSLDETGRMRFIIHRHDKAASGFRDLTLLSFERELLKSANSVPSRSPNLSSFEQELLQTTSVSDSMFYSGLRRASEPAPSHRSSFDAAYCPTNLRDNSVHNHHGSSACSTSSREMILDWLNQSQRSSGSSSGEGRRRRMRTTSSHLDWYAQDLLLEAFNDALKDIFGDVHSVMAGADRVRVLDKDDSIDNSFSSSQSTDQVCDTYIAIPVGNSIATNTVTTVTAVLPSMSIVSNNANVTDQNVYSKSQSNGENSRNTELKFGEMSSCNSTALNPEPILLSSTPKDEQLLHVTHLEDRSSQGDVKPKVIKTTTKSPAMLSSKQAKIGEFSDNEAMTVCETGAETCEAAV